MRRSLLLMLGLLLAGMGIVLGSFHVGARLSNSGLRRPVDDLEWLRLEFHLNEREMADIRALHKSYLPVCRSYCDRIAAAKAELLQALGPGTNVPPRVDQKLAEIGMLRAQCQAAMLRHFAEVSRLMPQSQGERYLAEMQRLALGAHEQIEQSMSVSPSAAHEHHGH